MTIQTPLQLVITIGIIALGTFLIRALPFFLFPAGKKRRALLPTSAQRSRALRSQCSSFTVLKMSLYFPVLMGCRSSSVPCSSLSSTNGGTTCCSPSSAARFYTCCSCSSFFRYSRKFCKKESCSTGFSACGGSRKRHSTIPPQCDPRGAFLSYGNEVSYTIKKNVPWHILPAQRLLSF